MNIERLKEFCTIARHHSLRAAAGELCVSPGTLNARMKAFEKDLGYTLFSVCGSRWELTAAGNHFYLHAKELQGDFEQLADTLVNLSGSYAYKQLRVAILGTSMPPHLGPFLDTINARYPNLHLQLLDDRSYSIESGLLNDEIDIYFAPAPPDFHQDGIGSYRVSSLSPSVIVHNSHHLSDRGQISFRDLDRETFLLYPATAEPVLRNYQLRCLNESGIRFQIYDDFSSPIFYQLMIPIGKGILFAPAYDVVFPPNCSILQVTDASIGLYETMFYKKPVTSPDVTAFIQDYINFTREAGQYGHANLV